MDEHGAEAADAEAAAEEGSRGGHAQVLYHPCGQSGAHTHCATTLLHTHLATAVAAVAAASETRSVHCAEHSPVTSTFAPKHHHSVLGSLSGEPSITYEQVLPCWCLKDQASIIRALDRRRSLTKIEGDVTIQPRKWPEKNVSLIVLV